MTALLTAQQLCVAFRHQTGRVDVLRDVSLSLEAGEVVGLVGESGSGKSTLARALLGLTQVSMGRVCWQGLDVSQLTPRRLRALRPSYQAIFQQPSASLSPRLTVFQSIAEPLGVPASVLDPRRLEEQTLTAMQEVGLSLDLRDRRPHQLSGGQCQRVAIARALVSRPRVLICDEVVSALDLSVQAQVLNLLMARCRSQGTAVLFVSHDLSVVRWLSDRVLVMQAGRLVEEGRSDQLFSDPQHAYTKQLIAASSPSALPP